MKTNRHLPVSMKSLAILTAMLVLLGYTCFEGSPTSPAVGGVTGRDNLDNNTAARLIRYEVKPEQQAAFRKVVADYVAHSLKQEGNILSEAYFEQEHPAILWVIERWSNHKALEKVSKEPAFQAIATLAKTALSQPLQTIAVKDLEPLSKQQWRRTAQKGDKPLTIMLFVDAKPGTARRFKEVYHTAMPQFRSEPGVITYQLSQLENDSTQFVTYEKFRDEAAFQYHLKFPPIQPVIDYLESSIKKQPFQSGLHRLTEFAPLARQ